jgi:hypothetical protein
VESNGPARERRTGSNFDRLASAITRGSSYVPRIELFIECAAPNHAHRSIGPRSPRYSDRAGPARHRRAGAGGLRSIRRRRDGTTVVNLAVGASEVVRAPGVDEIASV